MSKVSASNFRDPLLRVLGQMTGLVAGTDVSYGDTIEPTLETAGFTEDQFGTDTAGRPQTHVWINQAFNKKLRPEGLGAKGSKRGQWTLTPEGVRTAALLLGTDAPAVEDNTPEEAEAADDEFDAILESVSNTPEPEPEDTEDAAPVAAAPGGGGVSFTLGEQTNDYNTDPYIRGLAIEQTSCFGNFSQRSKVCEDCPLSGACKASTLEKLTAIAARLRKRDEEAARRANAPEAPQAPEEPEGEDDDDLDIEDIIAAIEDDEPDSDPNVTFMESVPANTICTTCGNKVDAGSKAYWVKGGGVHHPGCWKK